MNLPEEDRYLKTREELRRPAWRCCSAAARPSSSSSARSRPAPANDLQRVAEITHAMVHQYAMGSVGQPAARACSTCDAVSDITRRIRDEEQRELAYEAPHAAPTA